MKNTLINNNFSQEKVPKALRRYYAPALIFVLSLAVRWVHILAIYHSDPAFNHPFMDMRWHVEWARSIAMGLLKPEPFFRAPLYPFFLSGLFSVFGTQSLLTPRLVQGVVGAFGCVIFWVLGNKLGGKRTGLISGLIAAFYGPLIYFDSEFLIPVLFIPLIGISLVLLIKAVELIKENRGANIKLIFAGLFCGIAATAIPNVLIFVPFVFLWIFMELSRRKKSVLCFGIWLMAFIVPVGFVTAYNTIAGGGLVVVASQGGVNFWIGNNPLSDGKTAMAPAHYESASQSGALYEDSVRVNSTLEAQRLLGRKLRDDEVSKFWFGQAFKFIEYKPADWLKLTLKKIYFLMNGYELPSNIDIYSVRKYSPVLKVLLWNKPMAFPFGIIFPLAVLGMALSVRNPRSDRASARLLFFYFVVYGASVAAFFVTSRHRLPIITALIPFAAFSLASIPEEIRRVGEGGKIRALLLGAIFCLALLLSNTNYFDVRKVPLREDRINMGAVYIEEGLFDAALSEYRAALDEDPNCDRCLFNIGVTYLKMKKYDDAQRAFIDTLKINPQFADAYIHLGNLFLELKKYSESEKMYRTAISMEPQNALAHYNLAVLYKQNGDMENYISELIAANKAAPYFAPANIELAYELILQKRFQEAKTLLDKARVINPNDRRIEELLKQIPKDSDL